MFEVTVKVKPTPRQLAGELAGMDSGDQAKFFSCLAQEIISWRRESSFALQLQGITDNEHLTDEGRRVMTCIGDYAYRKGE